MRSRTEAARARKTATSNASTDGFFPPEEKPTAPSVEDSFEKAAAAAEGSLNYDAPSGGPILTGGFDRIVTRLYEIDADSEERELTEKLRLSMKASRAEYGMIVEYLDEAEDCARRAMKLFVNAKVAHMAFELDATAIIGAMRKEAVDALNAGKLDPEGKPIKGMKQITNDDVTAYCATNWADEWSRLELGREKSKRMCDYLERLADLWKARGGDLRVLAQGAK